MVLRDDRWATTRRPRGRDRAVRGLESAAASPSPSGAGSVRLRRAHAETAELLAEHERMRADERGRIARELHDGLQQSLAAARIALGEAMQQLSAESPGGRAGGLLALVDEQLVAAAAEVRRVVRGLPPGVLARLGLLASLREMAAGFGLRTGVRCRFVAPPDLPPDGGVPPHVAACIYRIVQEALNNVGKHAGARHALVELLGCAGAVQGVAIQDDGRGIDAAGTARADAFGLHGARGRAREIGADLRITSSPGLGTRLELRLPAPPEAVASWPDTDGPVWAGR